MSFLFCCYSENIKALLSQKRVKIHLIPSPCCTLGSWDLIVLWLKTGALWPASLHFPPPLGPPQPPGVSLRSVFLMPHGWDHTLVVFFCPTYFTRNNVLAAHPCCCKWQDILFWGWNILYVCYTYGHSVFLYPLGTLRLFPHLDHTLDSTSVLLLFAVRTLHFSLKKSFRHVLSGPCSGDEQPQPPLAWPSPYVAIISEGRPYWVKYSRLAVSLSRCFAYTIPFSPGLRGLFWEICWQSWYDRFFFLDASKILCL